MLLSIGIFHIFPAQAQQETLTDRAEQGDGRQDHNPKHHHYQLIDIGTFGGPNSNFVTQGVGAQNLNNRGVVTGSADTSIPDPKAPNCLNSGIGIIPDCYISHAFKWQKGSLTDLGSLPGVNSSYGSWITANGLVAGLSGNGEIDPLTGRPETRAVFWNNGPIIDLGTFGGNESYANAVNNRGQVVGSAANAISDPFNTGTLFGWGTQMHAFLWEDGVMHDLGTLGGPDSLAFYVNDAGQVAGFSYTSDTPNPLTGAPPGHPFLWENGTMHDLGTIGGTQVFDLDGLNERGQVIGQMTMADEVRSHPFFWDGKKLIDLGTFGGNGANANWFNDTGEVVGHSQYSTLCPGPGQGPIDHAYLWRNGVMSDLGTVPGINPQEGLSSAWGINSKTQIVGNAAPCDYSIIDAFLWENGSMVDLNTLIPPGSALHLALPIYISDLGEITGLGYFPNGDWHSFLLIPCDENHRGDENNRGDEGCDYDMVDAETKAQVRPAQITEPEMPASGAKLTPTETMNRYGSAMSRRNQRLRGLSQK
jgi:probable HAF family extracellular repeat protein